MKTYTNIYTKPYKKSLLPAKITPAKITPLGMWQRVLLAFCFTLIIGVVLTMLTGFILSAIIPVILFWVKASQYVYKQLYN